MHCIYPEDIPEEAIHDCSATGDVSEAVAYWVRKLGFSVPAHDARLYLQGFGAWEEEELEDEATNTERVLWLACCSFKEGNDIVCLEA